MQNNNEKSAEANVTQSKGYKNVFSDREVREIVKDFINAYISGQIKIDHPDGIAVMKTLEQEGKRIDPVKAEGEAVKLRVDFMHQVAICTGTQKATPKEAQTATYQLFKDIISYRSSHRIEGVFHDMGTESRLCKLEEGMEKVNKLIEELVEYLMKG